MHRSKPKAMHAASLRSPILESSSPKADGRLIRPSTSWRISPGTTPERDVKPFSSGWRSLAVPQNQVKAS
jgi:hypothetical protein